jgi:hypothetical protein
MSHLSPILEPTDIGSDVPLMIHLEADPEGCNIALCGQKLRGILCEGEAVDCVVCASLGGES